MDDFREPAAPGWNAIDDALRPIYGGAEPFHWGTIISWEEGGPDPIRGISAYRRHEPVPHLHYVTYGLSELYEKVSEDPAISGWGFELTFRLAHPPDAAPPGWVLGLLQNLGRHVFETRRVFGVGHTMSLNGPIALETDTLIGAIAFTLDPELGWIDTPNGQVEFLQVVGLTEDELAAIQCWNSQGFLELVRPRDAVLVTDLSRGSHLGDLDFARRVTERTNAEGASSSGLYCDHVRCERIGNDTVTLTLGAAVADDLGRRLRGRIPYGRPFSLFTDTTEIRFEPGDCFQCCPIEKGFLFQLSAAQSHVLTGLLVPQHAVHRPTELPGLTVVIEKTEIRDSAGNVVRTIG